MINKINNDTHTLYDNAMLTAHIILPLTPRHGQVLSQEKLSAATLVDSGAINGNFISSNLASELVNKYNIKVDTTNTNKSRCSAINTPCNNNFGEINLKIKLNNITLSGTFVVIDSRIDLVIGLKTIRQYDLTRRLRFLFTNTNNNNNNINQVQTNRKYPNGSRSTWRLATSMLYSANTQPKPKGYLKEVNTKLTKTSS